MFVLGGQCKKLDWTWSRNGFSWQKHHGCQSLSHKKVLSEWGQTWSSDLIDYWQWTCFEQGIGLDDLQRSFPTWNIFWFHDRNLSPVSDILWLCKFGTSSFEFICDAFALVFFQEMNTELISLLFKRGRGLLTIWYAEHSKSQNTSIPVFLSRRNALVTFLYSFLPFS